MARLALCVAVSVAMTREASASITYVDAVMGAGGNTTQTGQSQSYTGWENGANSAANDDDQWCLRMAALNGGTVFQAMVGTVGSTPELTTQITNLPDGDYEVWAFFWDNNTYPNAWNLAAGLTSGALTTYSFDGLGNTSAPVLASTLRFAGTPPIVTNSATLLLYAVYLGTQTVSGGSVINVFVDHLDGTYSYPRTWYDGVGYAPVARVWQNSNVTGTPASPLDWRSGGANAQAVWSPAGNPVSSSNTVIQFFQDTTTVLLNTATPSAQTANINNGGVAFELGELSLKGKASATSSANLTMTLSGDALNFSGETGTIFLDGVNNTRILTYNVDSSIQLGTVSTPGALTLTGNGTGVFNIGGAISERLAGGGSVTKSGSSKVTLKGANSYTGGTTIDAGQLQFNSGAVPATGSITVNAAGILLATGVYTSAGAWLASGKIAAGSSGVLTLTANNTADANFTGYDNLYLGTTGSYSFGAYTLTPGANGYRLGGAGGTLTISTANTLGAGQDLTVGGNLTLSAANNNFNQDITVNAGMLSLGSTTALGIPTSITLAGDTSLRAYVASTVIDAPITLGASGATVTINAEFAGTGGVVYTLTLNGAISGDGNLTLNGINFGNTYQTVILGGQSSYGGATLMNCSSPGVAFFVKLAVADALPVTTELTLDGGLGTGTGRHLVFELNGNDQTLGGLQNIPRNLRIQSVRNTSVTPATLTVNNTSDYTFSGQLGTSTATGNFGLTKGGSGKLTLTGANVYKGTTSVKGGTLSISMAYLADTADVTVATGAVLNLNFTGIDTVRGLYLDENVKTTGTWGGLSSDADHKDSHFTGNGKLLVTWTPGTLITFF